MKKYLQILAQKQKTTYICSIKQTNDIKQSFNRVKRTNHIIIMFPNQIVKIAPEVASQLSASEILQMIADNNNMADDGFSYTAYNDRIGYLYDQLLTPRLPVWKHYRLSELFIPRDQI